MKEVFSIKETTLKLSENGNGNINYLPLHGKAMPSVKELNGIVEIIRELIFPGYFDNLALRKENLQYQIGSKLDKVHHLLTEQIDRGLCFSCLQGKEEGCKECNNQAVGLSGKFLNRLPELKKKLSLDVKAMYEGDPAAKDPGEIIYCYPSIKAMTNYRIAHELHQLRIPLIPRIITETAHSETGIDIHPGAEIGHSFAIDHGTGVVIGETCVIGNNVKIYQGVTLGAKSFPLDKKGNPIKGIKRHPVVGDNVIIYAQATILGRVFIGENSVIGANVWITKDVEAGSKISK
jgi:serine O-acetyltransferase